MVWQTNFGKVVYNGFLNKPLQANSISEENDQGWKIVRKLNSWPRNKPLSATVKLWWQSLSGGHCLLLDMPAIPKWLALQNHSLTLERTKLLVMASALLRLNKCKLNSSPVASLFSRWKSLSHCYQIGRLLLPGWLPKSRPSRNFTHLKYHQTIVYSVSKNNCTDYQVHDSWKP